MSMSSPLWAYSLRWYLSHLKRKLKISSLLLLSLIATNCPRGLSIPDRSVSPNYCAAYSLAPVNVHLLTPCIHKLLQRRLCLADCSMIIRWLSCDSCHRADGACGVPSKIRRPNPLVLRYSDRNLQFDVLRNPVRWFFRRHWIPLVHKSLDLLSLPGSPLVQVHRVRLQADVLDP